MTRRVIWGLCALLGSASGAHAQIFGTGVTPVMEIGTNLYQNTITAVQSVAQTINQVKELLPLDALILGDEYRTTLEDLEAVTRETGALSHDLASLQTQVQQLFGLENVPKGSLALRQRHQALRQLVWEAECYAVRTQALIHTTVSTLTHIRRLSAAISHLVGNHQSNQTLLQVATLQADTLAQLHVMTTASQRAATLQQLEQVFMAEGQRQVFGGLLIDYPGGVPGSSE